VIRFRQADVLGGIDELIEHHRAEVQSFPVVELTTTTLGDVLDRAQAPRFIHYISIGIDPIPWTLSERRIRCPE
jgi:hypothetical protein